MQASSSNPGLLGYIALVYGLLYLQVLLFCHETCVVRHDPTVGASIKSCTHTHIDEGAFISSEITGRLSTCCWGRLGKTLPECCMNRHGETPSEHCWLLQWTWREVTRLLFVWRWKLVLSLFWYIWEDAVCMDVLSAWTWEDAVYVLFGWTWEDARQRTTTSGSTCSCFFLRRAVMWKW